MRNLVVITIALLFNFVEQGLSNYDSQYQDEMKIEVLVTGIEKIKGEMRFALYSENNSFPSDDDLLDFKIVPVNDDKVEVVFKVSEKGKYAIAIMHDLNKNGKMDYNFVGYPKDPYGFSTNPGIWFRRPNFEECSFDLNENTRIEIEMN